MSQVSRCVACGADLSSRYCPECGEAAGHHDYSLKHFAEEALETFAHLDGRVFSTFRSLVTRPGLLASDFLAGRRKIANGSGAAVRRLQRDLFPHAAVHGLLDLHEHAGDPDDDAAVASNGERDGGVQSCRSTGHPRRIHPRVQRDGAPAGRVAGDPDGAGVRAGRLGALRANRRFYAEHLVFAFYVFAFLMLWMGVVPLALSRPVLFGLRHGWSGDLIETTASTIISLPFMIYLFAAGRRTYARIARANCGQDAPPRGLDGRSADRLPFPPLLHDLLRDLASSAFANPPSQSCGPRQSRTDRASHGGEYSPLRENFPNLPGVRRAIPAPFRRHTKHSAPCNAVALALLFPVHMLSASSVASRREAAVPCRHCGEPCHTSWSAGNGPFCCNGCEAVFTLLQDRGLDAFYQYDFTPGVSQRRKASLDDARFAPLDRPDVAAQVVEFDDGRTAIATFAIPTIHCASCVWLLEQLWRFDAGTTRAEVDLQRRTVRVEYRPSATSPRRIAEQLSVLGYEPALAFEGSAAAGPDRRRLVHPAWRRRIRIRQHHAVQHSPLREWRAADGGVPGAVRSTQRAPCDSGVRVQRLRLFPYAWHAVRRATIALEVPVALGLLVLFGRSLFEIVSGRGEGFMDSFAGLVFFLLLGKLSQQKVFDRIALTAPSDRFFRCRCVSIARRGLRRFPSRTSSLATASSSAAGRSCRPTHGC